MKLSLLSDINYCHPNTDMCVFTNIGNLDYKHSDTIYLFPLRVFYNPDSISNILSLIDVTIQFRVTMNTNNKPAMFIHTVPDYVLKFYQCIKVLYYFDTYSNNVMNPPLILNLSLVLSKRAIFFHRSKIKGVHSDRILQQTIEFQYITKFKTIAKSNKLLHFTRTVSDIDKEYAIYGPRVTILQGQSVWKFPIHIEKTYRSPLPLPIQKGYKNVSPLIDYTFINGQPYFLTKLIQYQFSLYSGMHRLKQSITKERSRYSQTNIIIQGVWHHTVSWK